MLASTESFGVTIYRFFGITIRISHLGLGFSIWIQDLAFGFGSHHQTTCLRLPVRTLQISVRSQLIGLGLT